MRPSPALLDLAYSFMSQARAYGFECQITLKGHVCNIEFSSPVKEPRLPDIGMDRDS